MASLQSDSVLLLVLAAYLNVQWENAMKDSGLFLHEVFSIMLSVCLAFLAALGV